MTDRAEQIPNKAEEKLMELGFTNYQARVYRAVFILQECSIAQIANFSKVPAAKIYSVIRELERQGLIAEIPKSRPVRFKAFPPDQTLERKLTRLTKIADLVKEDFKNLQQLRNKHAPPKETETLLIRNELLIKNLILDALKAKPQEITLLLHEDFEFYKELLRNLDSTTSITLIDPFERDLHDFFEKFSKTLPSITLKKILSIETQKIFQKIPIFFITDENIFITISQTEQNLEFLYIKSPIFSEFLKILLQKISQNEESLSQ